MWRELVSLVTGRLYSDSLRWTPKAQINTNWRNLDKALPDIIAKFLNNQRRSGMSLRPLEVAGRRPGLRRGTEGKGVRLDCGSPCPSRLERRWCWDLEKNVSIRILSLTLTHSSTGGKKGKKNIRKNVRSEATPQRQRECDLKPQRVQEH